MRQIAENQIPGMLKEQFVPDHVFVHLKAGSIRLFEGNSEKGLKAGQSCLVRKNQLIRFLRANDAGDFSPVLFCFEESLLADFQKKYQIKISSEEPEQSGILPIADTAFLKSFLLSVQPYTKGVMELEPDFEDLKYEELLLILLRENPAIKSVLFDFGIPGKINLEAFMNKNFRFNTSLERFAFLTGRSLSAFKRDFKKVFNVTPGRWLLKRRLDEAYLAISQQGKKASDIYLELGFESLAHFSTRFKEEFQLSASELLKRN